MAIFTLESIQSGDIVARNGCYLCLTDHRTDWGPLVDCDMPIVGEGRLVLCARCLHSLAAILGFAVPAVVEQCLTELATVTAERNDLKDRLNQALQALDIIKQVKSANVQPISKKKSPAKRNPVAAAAS